MWPYLILYALGAYGKNREQAAAVDRQQELTRRRRARDREDISDMRNDVMDTAREDFSADVRSENLADAETQQATDVAEFLDSHDFSVGETQGKVSDSALNARADALREGANKASIMAALRSKIAAPNLAKNKENDSISDLIGRQDTDKLALGRRQGNDSTLLDLVGMLNDKNMLIGGIAEGIGMAGISGNIMSGLGGAGTAAKAGAPMVSPNPSPQPSFFDQLSKWGK